MLNLDLARNAHHQRINIDKLHVTTEHMFRGTPALGGRLFIDDGEGKERTLLMPAKFCSGMKETYYAIPVPITVLWYGEDALGFERVDTKERLEGSPPFVVRINENLADFKAKIAGQDWYFDGEFMYQLEANTFDTDGNPLGQLDSRQFFTLVNIPAFQPTVLFDCKYNGFSMYHGVVCQGVMTPPMWGTIDAIAVGHAFLLDGNMLDVMDSMHVISLQGLLKICEMSSKLFGVQSIECFDLPLYMIVHKTVNLPALSNAVKTTSPSGMVFSDALSWHIGKFFKCACYKEVKAVKRSLKYIASYGLVKKNVLDHKEIFLSDKRPAMIKVA